MISLDSMAALARSLTDADAEAVQAEVNLKAAKERARILREETIPSAMQELGLEKLKLESGQEISITQEVYASIPEAQKGAAFGWLEDNGFGSIIKTEVTVAYGKGGLEEANELHRELLDKGLNAGLDRSVHAQTLKAFLREQIRDGKNIPLDYFGARPVWTAKVKG